MKILKSKQILSCVLSICMIFGLFVLHIPDAYAQEADEVTIDAVEYGADPTGEEDSTQAIQAAFAAAKQASENGAASVTVSFPKGEYQIYKDYAETRVYHTSNTNSIGSPTKTIGLLIEDQENFTLDGNGSLFLMHGNMMALAVVNSKNVTLKDFSWDFGNPTITEMTVTNIGTDNGKDYTEFLIPECFSYEISGNTIVWHSETSPYTGDYYWTQTGIHSPSYGIVAYQPDGGMSRNYATSDGPFSNVSAIEQIDSTHVKITYNGSRPSMQQMGTVIELAANAYRETAGAFTWESENVTARNLNVHYMHGFGWLIQMSKNIYYYDCNLTPREGSGHITVSFADGIHASGAAGDLVIENCNFANTHDDPINLHGTFTRVEQRIDEHTLQMKYIHTQQGGFPQFHVGDQVAFFTRDTLESTDNETLYTVKQIISNPGESGNDLRTMVIEFEGTLPETLSDTISGEPKYVAENVTYAPTVTIRNCTFEHVPTRGILCTTRNPVLIEGNTFKNMSIATIYLSNDSNDWYESGPIRNMTIKDNEFFIKSIGRTSWEYAPAVYVNPITKGGALPLADNPIHKNITIEGNIFHMDTDTVVKAESVENLTIRDNTILRANPDIRLEITASQTSLLTGDMLALHTTADGDTHERPQDNVYEFTNCKNVLLEGNTYDDGLKRYAVLSGMPDNYLTNLDTDIKIAYDREQPVSAPVQNIGYRSSNPDVLSIDANGKMSAKTAGVASVYAYYNWNGEIFTSEPIEMTVKDKSDIAPEDVVTIQCGENPMLTEAESTLAFHAETASQKAITWSVEDFLTGGDTTAAVIDENGVLTAKESGIVWVKASAGLSTNRIAVIISILDTNIKNEAFTVTREDTENYAMEADKVTVNMKTGDLYESTNTVKNLFLYQIPTDIDKDNMRTVIKIANLPERENEQWDTASFLLYQNDDNYISVGKKSHYDGISIVEETNASAAETGGNAAQNALSEAYFGFYKNGSNVSVDFKAEDGNWQHISGISASMLQGSFRIGFAAWATNEGDKKVIFSDFYAGSGDLSYDQLCAQAPISFFQESTKHIPTVSDAAFDQTDYQIGDTAVVTYTFLDEDGDAEGKTLYCFSYDNGICEVTDQPSLKLAYTGTLTCDIYPVDTNGIPGLKTTVAGISIKPESDPEPEPKPEPEPEPEPEPDPEPEPGQKPGPEPEKKPGQNPDPKPDSALDSDSVLNTVPVPSAGTAIEAGGIRYKVTKSDAQNGTVAVIKLLNKKLKNITIPDTIQKDGYTFRVTAIQKNAFKNASKLKRIVIGTYVATIGKSAFSKCKKLSSIQFLNKKAPKIQSKALKGIFAKCKIIVPKKMPKKQLNKLKRAVKSAGAGSKVKFVTK